MQPNNAERNRKVWEIEYYYYEAGINWSELLAGNTLIIL